MAAWVLLLAALKNGGITAHMDDSIVTLRWDIA